MTIKIKVSYFAQLRELAAKSEENLSISLEDRKTHLEALYLMLKAKYHFPFLPQQLRVAVNGSFALWDRQLCEGDEIVFIPPVTGG